MISVWPKFYSFNPKMVLHFHFTFKPFSGHAQKREIARERERERERERRVKSLCSWPITPQGKSSSPRSSKASIAEIVRSFDHWNRPPRSARSREAPRRSRSRLRANRDRTKRRSRPREPSIAIARSTAPIMISPSRRSQSREASIAIARSTMPIAIALSVQIWSDLMIFFFSGFCLCFCIEKWMILYIRLATEKMWENVSKPNTRKYFSKHFLKCNQTLENIFLSQK